MGDHSKIDGKYIRFVAGPPKAKTLTWFVINKDSEQAIGEIKWYGAWRRYSFFPFTDTVYEMTCLDDIAEFLREQTQQRKVSA